jgi:proteasome lid subunit RPN8/RPN11
VRSVAIPGTLLGSIAAHARATYPEECCGFLIAEPDLPDGRAPRRIVEALAARNEYEGERARRFLLRPEELRAVERRIEGTGRVLAGFYHSHPDHPAEPSQFDRDHAWPWYSYLVVHVNARAVGETRGFELDPETSEFREVLVLPHPATDTSSPMAIG